MNYIKNKHFILTLEQFLLEKKEIEIPVSREWLIDFKKEMYDLYDDVRYAEIDLNNELIVRLKEKGLERCRLIEGTFQTDFPYEFDDYDSDINVFMPTHYWVEYEGKIIIDVTIKSFEEYVDEKIPEVLVSDYDTEWRYTKKNILKK